MILDLERDEPLPKFSADVCIVGAGAGGIVLAAELLRHGRRVLLLESGGSAIEPAAQELNDFVYTGQPHQGANIGRFRALGGTTTVWGGQILELDEQDFAARPWIPGSGWPFAKQELQPYYRRAIVAEGLSGAIQSDREISEKMRTGGPYLGKDFIPYFTRWCPEPNFARLFRPILESPNICVVLHATATAVLLDEGGARVRGIRCKTFRGREHTFSAPRYAFSLGTIESVRFLLQPLPGAHTHPWNRSGLLGHHFHSHIDLNAASVPPSDAAHLQRWFANAYLGGYKYHPKFRLALPRQQQEKTLNIAGSITCIHQAETELRKVKSLARNFVQRRSARATLEDLPRVFRQLSTMLRLGYSYRVHHRAAWPRKSSFWLRAVRSNIVFANCRWKKSTCGFSTKPRQTTSTAPIFCRWCRRRSRRAASAAWGRRRPRPSARSVGTSSRILPRASI